MKKKSLNRILNRSWATGAAYNNLRGQGHGCLYALYPYIEEMYPNPEDSELKKEAIKRHLVFYNITPQVTTVGLGLFASLEEKAKNDNTFDVSTINALKAAIMGPASGIGDALFQVTVRIVAASIGLGFAMSGSPLGGILFWVIFNLCSYMSRKYLLKLSYNTGEKIVSETAESGIVKILSNSASVIGLFMVGAMVATTVKVDFALTWLAAGNEVTLQSFFDAIMPKLVPLALTISVMYAVKNKINANLIMVLMILLGIIGAYVGLF